MKYLFQGLFLIDKDIRGGWTPPAPYVSQELLTFFDEIANNSKTAAPRDLKLRFLAKSGLINRKPPEAVSATYFQPIVRNRPRVRKIG